MTTETVKIFETIQEEEKEEEETEEIEKETQIEFINEKIALVEELKGSKKLKENLKHEIRNIEEDIERGKFEEASVGICLGIGRFREQNTETRGEIKYITYDTEVGKILSMGFPKHAFFVNYGKDIPMDVLKLMKDNKKEFERYYVLEPERDEGTGRERGGGWFDPLLVGISKRSHRHYLLAQWGAEKFLTMNEIKEKQQLGKKVRLAFYLGMLGFTAYLVTYMAPQAAAGYCTTIECIAGTWLGLLIPSIVFWGITAGFRFPTPFRSRFFRLGEDNPQ